MCASDFLLEDLDLGTVVIPPEVRGSTPCFSNSGLLLLVRALFSGSEFEPSEAGGVALPARVAERRVLPKYSSLGVASAGEGEMTSCVFGMGIRREDMVKKLQAGGISGRQGEWMRPQIVRLIEVMAGEEASKTRPRLMGSAGPKGLPLRIMLPAIASVLGWACCFLE